VSHVRTSIFIDSLVLTLCTTFRRKYGEERANHIMDRMRLDPRIRAESLSIEQVVELACLTT